MIQYVLMILVSLLASIGGSICGIGGGIIIKPVLDSLHMMDVAAVSFLSGFTVLCMAAYSVGTVFLSGKSAVRLKTCVPMSAGAVFGGIVGKALFSCLRTSFDSTETVGAVQSLCLFLLTGVTFVYTMKKARIRTLHVANTAVSTLMGFILGMLSSFLGIGGGPFNLVFLSYFFSMDTKEAVQNSLFIILFSQISSVCQMIVTGKVPEVPLLWVALMSGMGILGAAIGKRVNKRMDSHMVDRLFLGMLVVVMGVCCSNIYNYL